MIHKQWQPSANAAFDRLAVAYARNKEARLIAGVSGTVPGIKCQVVAGRQIVGDETFLDVWFDKAPPASVIASVVYSRVDEARTRIAEDNKERSRRSRAVKSLRYRRAGRRLMA